MTDSNDFRRDTAKLLATANILDLAGVLMEVTSRLLELRPTIAQSGSVHAAETLTRIAEAESEIERVARKLSFTPYPP